MTLSEEQASSEEGDSRERLSIVHTDADRGPSSTTTTLVSIGSPPPRPRSGGGPDRGNGGPPWTRGALYHGGPCRPSDIPRQTMEELKTTLRDGPHLAFRVQGDVRSRGPSTSHLKGQNAVQGGGGGSSQGHRRVLTTFKPHEGGASMRSPGPGDTRAGQHPSSSFRPDAFTYRHPGGQDPPHGGRGPSDEAGSSQTGKQLTRKDNVLVILPHKWGILRTSISGLARYVVLKTWVSCDTKVLLLLSLYHHGDLCQHTSLALLCATVCPYLFHSSSDS